MYLFRQIKSIFFVLMLFGLLLACQKEPLKQPVSVNLSIDMNRLSDPLHSYHFEVGNIWIQSIRLLGDRVEGEDIDYFRDFPGGLALDMNGQLNLNIHSEKDVQFTICHIIGFFWSGFFRG